MFYVTFQKGTVFWIFFFQILLTYDDEIFNKKILITYAIYSAQVLIRYHLGYNVVLPKEVTPIDPNKTSFKNVLIIV